MDTRTKIVGRDGALRAADEAGLAVVTGYFDPLTAAHACRLEEIAAGTRLVVVVRTPEDPILPARARAELVAALGCVQSVVIEEGDPGWIDTLPASRVVREEEADLERRRELVARIHRRQAVR